MPASHVEGKELIVPVGQLPGDPHDGLDIRNICLKPVAIDAAPKGEAAQNRAECLARTEIVLDVSSKVFGP